jgi:hypothetical protein
MFKVLPGALTPDNAAVDAGTPDEPPETFEDEHPAISATAPAANSAVEEARHRTRRSFMTAQSR